MGFLDNIGGIAGAAIGGLAGSMGSNQNQTSTVQMEAAGELEKQGYKIQQDQISELEKLVNLGPGAQAITNANSANTSFADMLKSYSQGGFMPNQQQVGQANQFAGQVFAPQYEQMRQQFDDQRVQGSRAAARMGRGAADPVLLNKMMQEQSRQQRMLDAQQGSFSAQYAQQMPQQQLGYAQQLAQFQGGLASQAMANRQALFSMGNNVQQFQANFRNATATRTNAQSGGGGLGGALTGALAGAGMGMQAQKLWQGMNFGSDSFAGMNSEMEGMMDDTDADFGWLDDGPEGADYGIPATSVNRPAGGSGLAISGGAISSANPFAAQAPANSGWQTPSLQSLLSGVPAPGATSLAPQLNLGFNYPTYGQGPLRR